MAALFTVHANLVENMEAYLAYQKASRGRTEMQTLQRVMGYWISFAMAKVRRADREQIMLYLMGKTRLAKTLKPKTRRKAAARNEILKNTLAIAIVVKTDYRKRGRAARGPELYKLTEKYIKARGFAAGHHRAGFIPALLVLKEPRDKSLPVYRRGLAGRISFTPPSVDEMTITVENWAKAIAEIAPDAFEQATRDLENRLGDYLEIARREAMKAAGLNVT